MQNQIARMYSIGEVSHQTGLSVLRIRAWANRHGEPRGIAVEASGHRRYTQDQLNRLKLLATLTEDGRRIGDLTSLSNQQLLDLVEEGATKALGVGVSHQLWSWRTAVAKSDPKMMLEILNRSRVGISCTDFLETWAAPMVVAIGDWWANGEISITQEHVASSVIENFLTNQRLLAQRHSTEIRMLFCTLPLEQHTLGLQMAAMQAAEIGVQVIYAGRRIPKSEIPLALKHYDVKVLCLSFSISADPVMVRSELESLRKMLPEDVHILAGGMGMVDGVADVDSFSNFKDFKKYCQKLIEENDETES